MATKIVKVKASKGRKAHTRKITVGTSNATTSSSKKYSKKYGAYTVEKKEGVKTKKPYYRLGNTQNGVSLFKAAKKKADVTAKKKKK